MSSLFSDPNKAAKRAAAEQRAREEARQAQIRQGTQSIDDIFGRNFNDGFYNGRKQSFIDYASPQLEDQYGDARKALTFSLDRGGVLDSSIRADKFGELEKLYAQNRQQIGDQALSYEGEARNNVENARAGLLQMLNSSADASGVANQALSRAQALSAPQAYSPLSQLFATFTSGLGQQAAQERAEAMSGGLYKAKLNTGLFANNPNAVKVS